MNLRPHPPPPASPATASEPAETRTWRLAAFAFLMLACLGVFVVLTLLDDPLLLRSLVTLTTHEPPGPRFDPVKVALIVEHIHWWILLLPLIALLAMYAPLGQRRHGDRGTAPPPSRAPACPPFILGLFLLQLCIGAGVLTGTWTAVADRFWGPVPLSDDRIRAAHLSRGSLATSRRLETKLPPDAKIYILTDPGETPIFLNYYLYPRRLYSSESGEESGYVDEVVRPDFWEARRAEGFRWVFLHRPGRDPVGGGHLIELTSPDPDTNEPPPEDSTP